MRDIVFLLVLSAALPYAAMHPWAGALLWTWISLMNPHQYTWVAQSLPVAAAVAAATLAGLLFSKDRKHLPLNAVTVSLFVMLVWMSVTTAFAYQVPESLEMLKKVGKIQLMVLVTLALLHSREHINWFTWVIVGSLGYYGVKGGIFTLATGGGHRVWGPQGSFIEGNNELALALIMTIPLMYYLRQISTNRWIRHGMLAAIALTAAAALGSHSRGALVAIAAMTVFLWWRSRQKVILGALMVIVGTGLLAFMPQQWEERMSTIQTYEQDESAMGRIYTWKAMYSMASDRITGGGFDMYSDKVFSRYSTGEDVVLVRAAHSIYFQVMGEHGFIGLALFLLFWFLVWRTAGWVYRHSKDSPETAWAGELANMCQVSLVGYAVGGAFLSLAYFDLPYNMMILVVLARVRIEATLAAEKAERLRALALSRAQPHVRSQA
jgi:probable O-glycosylation ligase (exosortase A-associated)